MEKQSLADVVGWLHTNRDAVVVRVPKLKELVQTPNASAPFSVRPEQLTELWKDIMKHMKEMHAPEHVEAEARSLLADAESETRAAAPSTSNSPKTLNPKIHALATHSGGTAPITPLFWRGCAFGALAAVSSGIGAGGALLACILVGAFAD